MDTLEKSLVLTFACFSMSAAAFCFYSEVLEKYKSERLFPVLLKALASSTVMAILGPWGYFVLIKSVVEDIKARHATLSYLLSSTLVSFVPMALIVAISESAVIGYHVAAVVTFSAITITVLLRRNDL